jgi:hypothetical protein
MTSGTTGQLEPPKSWNDRTAGTTGQLAGTTGQLERPDSWNEWKAGTTGQLAGTTGQLERPESQNYQNSRNDRIDPYANTLAEREGMFIS